MKKLFSLAVLAAFLWTLAVPMISFAQTPPSGQKCEGPPDLCAQILDLRTKLDAQKALKEKAEGEKSAAQLKAQQDQADKTARAIAAAASIAIMLKLVLSGLKSWKGYFTTDKGKAWLKITTLVIGFVAFILTNRGMGMAWWQALIVGGGGPGAILAHELSDLVPVLLGKKKYVSASDPPPPNKPGDEDKPEPESTERPAA